MMSFLQRWRDLNEWLKSLVLALLLIAVLHLLVFRFVVVENISMYATLRPGDLLLVERWPLLSGIDRGSIVVFRDPLRDQVPRWKRPLMVKRIAGMPGDVVQLERAELRVNDVPTAPSPAATRAFLVRLRSGASSNGIRQLLGLPDLPGIGGGSVLEVPLNDSLAALVEALPEVMGVVPMRLATGAPRHLFPFSERFAWNGDNYGPITVPRRGDTLHITTANLPLYDRLITIYEGQRIAHAGDSLLLNGQPLTTYVVQQDYYFMLGDGLHSSSDSRYWGFLPADHLMGRVRWVLTGIGADGARSGPRRLW
ncbi:MAG: signal peptidase I [Flavobacteriales bacterium]